MPAASSKALRQARFYRCPVGEALDPESWVARALQIWRWSERGAHLGAVLKRPTIAARQAMDIIAFELGEVDALVHKINNPR